MDYDQLNLLKSRIEKMDKFNQIKILSILNKSAIQITENRNGIFINLTFNLFNFLIFLFIKLLKKIIVLYLYAVFTISDLIGILRSLSSITLNGDVFSNPLILQVNFGLSLITVLTLVSIASCLLRIK